MRPDRQVDLKSFGCKHRVWTAARPMSGFQNAPITQTLLITTTIASLAISLSGLKPYAALQFSPHMTVHHQWWRFLTFQLVYVNSVELLMCLQVFYSAGVQVERLFGSRKFAGFCLLAYTAAIVAALPITIVANSLPAGSFALVGAIATQYELATPTLYRLRVFGMPLSSKSILHLNLVLLVWHQPKALLSLITGCLFTLLYPRLPAVRLPFPSFDSTVAPPRRQDRTLPLEFGEMPGAREARQLAQFRRARAAATTAIVGDVAGTGAGAGGGGNQARQATTRLSRLVGQVAGRANDVVGQSQAPSAPSEQEITTIAGMFPNVPRARIIEALQRHDWNSARAVESLLEA